jgi:zinc protease
MVGGLLKRGTKTKNRQQIQDETDRLKAQLNVWGNAGDSGAWLKTVEANLPDALRLTREVLRDATFPEAEFEEVRQQRIASAESQKTEPNALAGIELSRHMNAQYPRGDVRYESTLDEQIEDLKNLKLEEVRQVYHDFFAPAEGQISVVGQFDPVLVKKLLTELFGDWKSGKPYARITESYAKVDAINRKIEMPDKQNAIFLAASAFKMNDEDPDYAALTMGGMILGGSANSRLFLRIRVKDGLSYGAGASFGIPTKDDDASLNGYAIAAPQNMPKVEAAFQEEIARILKDGVTADELEKAKKTWLDARVMDRGNESHLAGKLESEEHWGRTLQWDEQLEAKVAALTPQQVNDALKRHLDPASLSIVKGGDFKKADVYQQ